LRSDAELRMRAAVAVLSFLVVALATGAPVHAASPTARSGDLLPNLVPLVPTQLHPPRTDVLPFSTTTLAPVVIDGCLAEEIVRTGALRCLRFDTRIANVGPGPLEVAYTVDGPDVRALQRIYRRDGSFRERRAAGSEFHATHTHFHIKDFYVSRLWRLAAGGERVGAKPLARTLKNGFCPEDSSNYGGGEARYGCRSDLEYGNGVRQIVGISSGWMDIYGYNLPDQFLEVSEVKPGRYLLEITIDPNDNFRESDELDNSVCAEIKLSADEASVLRERRCPGGLLPS
jgi:hypothetical protein